MRLLHKEATALTKAYRRLFGIFTALFAVGLCAALPILTVLILRYIDPNSHFYTTSGGLVAAAQILLAVVTALLILPLFFRSAGDGGFGRGNFSSRRRPAVAAFAALEGAALAVSSAWNVLDAGAKGTGAFLTGLCGIAAAVFFFLLCAQLMRGGRGPDLRMAALLPVLWSVVALVAAFMTLTQIANISQYLYEVLQMVFASLFLYYHARLTGGLSNHRELNGVFALGLPCAFYGFAATLPNYFAHLANHARGRMPVPGDYALLALSLYILALLVSLLREKPATEAPAAPDAPGEPKP